MAGDRSSTWRNSTRVYWSYAFLLSTAVAVAAAFFLHMLDGFDPAPMTPPLSTAVNRKWNSTFSARNDHILRNSTFIGSGVLVGPEDLAYDSEMGVIYTGCMDGWVKRIWLHDPPEVENWVWVGGRPLGIAIGQNRELLVAHPDKGLLLVSRGGVQLLTDEAEGVKFRLTDGVDVADDGTIYFTDASHVYGIDSYFLDFLEMRPHGRLLRYDAATNRTHVLLRDLYFPNGVTLSPDQQSLIFCETPLSRCRRYHLRGEREGVVENFIERMPGLPDNIQYDPEGRYWIGLLSESTPSWEFACKYPFVRKLLAVMEKYGIRPDMLRNGGVLAVDLEGNPIALYRDMGLSMISSGLKIGNRLFCGSVEYPHLITFNLTDQIPPLQSAS